MKYWVFNEEQVDKALREWMVERGAAGDVLSYPPAETVKTFLLSNLARRHGLRGDVAP